MKRKFNVVDIVLIALVAAAAVGVLALRDRSTGAAAVRETVPMRFTVEFTRAPGDMAEQMKAGTDVFRSTDGEYLGKAVEVRRVPHVESEYSPVAGGFVQYEYQGSYDVYLTIENEGYVAARDIVIGTAAPKVCGEMPVKGKGFARLGYVVDIDTMGAELVPDTGPGSGELEITYVIRMDDLRTMLLDSVSVGDTMYENLTGARLGEVAELWTEPYAEMHYGPDGAVYAEKAGRHYLYIRLKGRAVEKADGYYLDGGTELKVGSSVAANSRRFSRIGLFYALESIERVG